MFLAIKSEVDKLLIPKEFDRRIKLTDEDKANIISFHSRGMSQRALARYFNVSRRLISFILFPDRLIINKQQRLESGGSKQYYNKEKQKIYSQKTRKYRKQLELQNLLQSGSDVVLR